MSDRIPRSHERRLSLVLAAVLLPLFTLGAAPAAHAKKAKHGGSSSAGKSAPDSDSPSGGGDVSEQQEDELLGRAPAPKKRPKPAPADDEETKEKKEKSSPERASRSGASSSDSAADGEVSKRASAPNEEKPDDDESSAVSATPALELGLGGMALFRQLAWTSDARAAGLGPYTLAPGPEAGLWLEFYPAAFVTSGVPANIGLYARYNYGFGVTSYTPGGGDVETKYQDFLAGLKLRIPLGNFTPNLTVAFGEQSFRLTAEGRSSDLPAMDYLFFRVGGGTRVQFTPEVALDASVAFLAVTNPGTAMGQIAAQGNFPGTKAYAADLGASLAVRIAPAIGLRGGLDFRQYGIALNPSANAARAVTGAVDRYIVVFAGAEVVLDGLPPTDTLAKPPKATDEDSAKPAEESDDEAPAPKKKKAKHKDDDEDA